MKAFQRPGFNAPIPALLNMQQAVRMTGRTYGMLYRHAIEGKIKCHQVGVGTKMFFTLGAIADYLALEKPVSKPAKKIGR